MQNMSSLNTYSPLIAAAPLFMPDWNYRIVARDEGDYELHRVYYNRLGEACAMTDHEVTFEGGTRDESVQLLERAIVDARTRPVFVIPSKWAPADLDASKVLDETLQ
jgi:DNA helicase HerA-like ATPase